MLFVSSTMPRYIAAAILFSILISGDALSGSGIPEDHEPLKLIVHHQSATCGTLIESQWLADQEAYQSVFGAMFRGRISDAVHKPSLINFDKQAMLLISMGQQRTGGFSVKLAAEYMEVSGNRATISVEWVTLKPGMMAIQMLTNPCLLLEVPRGEYNFIDVVDQFGKTRQSISVAH